MKLKIALATATALGLCMGTAWAGGNNQSAVQQNGNNNVASIDQSAGNNNSAGSANYHAAYGNIEQNGDENFLDITQEGSGNDVANWTGGNGGLTGNFRQNGPMNSAVILQQNQASGSGSSVGGAVQNSETGATVNANVLNVIQTYGATTGLSNQGIRTISQTNTLMNVANANDANSIDVLQSGVGFHEGNALRTTSQSGSGNSQDIDQIGQKNYINEISQSGPGNDLTVGMSGTQNILLTATQINTGGVANTASITLDGDNNGAGVGGSVPNWAPWSIPTTTVVADAFSSGAGAAGVGQAVVYQSGVGNVIGYQATGNNNLYGFRQDGTDNQATNIMITGDRNQLGVNQLGTNNQLQLAAINGDDNNLGLFQDGWDNNASITIATGGNRNGGYHAFGSSGANVASSLAGSKGLTAGLLEQHGTNNQVTLNVTGSDNVFASLQDNTSYSGTNALQNVITGTVAGSFNEAAVVQQGNNNSTTFSQTGGNNYASINQ